MSKVLDTVVEKSLVVLDVPLSIAEWLSQSYGSLVWWQLVGNSSSRVAPLAALRVLEDDHDYVGSALVRSALVNNVPGVRDAVVSCKDCPDYLVYWMVQHKILSEQQQRVLVGVHHSKEIRRYLAHSPALCAEAAQVARRKACWLRRVTKMSELYKSLWNSTGSLSSTYYGDLVRLGEAPQPWHHFGSREELVEIARVVGERLGDGTGPSSRAQWERLFDLARSGVSDDLVALAHVACLVSREGHACR